MKSGTFFSTELFSAISHSLSNPNESDSIELGDKVKFQGGENPIYLGKFIDLLNTSYFLTRTDQHTIASIELARLPGLGNLLNQPPVIELQALGINGDIRRVVF